MRKGPELPELLMRIPLLFFGPGIEARPGPSPAHVSIVDIAPTLCEFWGVPLPYGMQGRSLVPLLTGREYPDEEFSSVYGEQGFGGLHYTDEDDPEFDRCLIPGPKRPTFDCLNSYSQSGSLRMIRAGSWKLALDMQGRGQLYDLSADPQEGRNLFEADEHALTRSRLLQELLAWCLRAQDPLLLPERGKYKMKRDERNYWDAYR